MITGLSSSIKDNYWIKQTDILTHNMRVNIQRQLVNNKCAQCVLDGPFIQQGLRAKVLQSKAKKILSGPPLKTWPTRLSNLKVGAKHSTNSSFLVLGEVIVALANDGGFQLFTQEGRPLRRIKLQQKELSGEASNFFVPEALAVDSADNMFAVDSNSNRLIVFSKEGGVLARFAQQNLDRPFGVAVDRLGRVVVTDSSNQVKIFWRI